MVIRKSGGPKDARAAVPPKGRTARRNAVSRKPAAPITKKGANSRERLKEAAARVLERIGYRAMRLNDIAAEADVNVSLFYHYFSSKAEITSEILRDLIERLAGGIPRHRGEEDAFGVIVDANRALIKLYSGTPGLMRCLSHFDEEEAEFSKLYREVSLEWNRKVARDIAKRFARAEMAEGHRLMIAYALGGMVDAFLFEMYVDRNELMLNEFDGDDDVARFLAILWYRTLHLANPPEDELGKYEAFSRLMPT